MASKSQLEEYFSLLRSTKYNDRKKACEKLSNLLDDTQIVEILNNDDFLTWDNFLESIQVCMQKDAEKADNEYRKKDVFNDKSTIPSRDLFSQLLGTAIKKGNGLIGIHNLVYYIDGCLRDLKMKRCYLSTFLVAIKEYILSNPKSRGQLDPSSWNVLLDNFKTLIAQSTSQVDGNIKYKCFMLIIKYGQFSGLPPGILREQFEFVENLCQKASLDSPRYQQENVMELVLNFCAQTAEDNRASCCKLGETVFPTILDLYVPNGHESKIKDQMVEFFLLQVVIHHPGGATEGDSNAYASNWSDWNLCLKRVYKLLNSEIYLLLKKHQKPTCFSKGKQNLISDIFINLFVEVSRQLILRSEVSFDMSFGLSLSCSSQPLKKQRIEVNINTYILHIKETKNIIWVNLMSEIFYVYPDLFNEESYLNLLRTLLSTQSDCKDTNLMDSLYTCQSVMLDSPKFIDFIHNSEETLQLWKLVGESTLKAVGLNQNIDATQNLLQKLIPMQVITDFSSVLKTFTSGMMNITESAIRTLEVVLKQGCFSHLQIEEKKSLISSILKVENLRHPEYMLSQSTANVLIALVLKQWPGEASIKSEKVHFEELEEIKDIYYKTNFQKDILERKNEHLEFVQKKFTYESECLDFLSKKVLNLKDELLNGPLDKLIFSLVLLSNLLSFMLEYSILESSNITDNILLTMFIELQNCDSILKGFNEFLTHDERFLKKIKETIEILDSLFCQKRHAAVSELIKEHFPLEVLKSLFNVLEFHQQGSKENVHMDIKVALIKTLSKFCSLSGFSKITTNQGHVLEVLARPDYDYSCDADYRLSMAFLQNISHIKAGYIPDPILTNILTCLQAISAIRYLYYEDTLSILQVLKELYPHITKSKNNELKLNAVNLLFPFYINREKYGSAVSVSILQCINTLCLVDPHSNFSLWEQNEIIRTVPEFLCSDWQVVRFEAIRTLISFFEVTSTSKQLKKLQSNIFDIMLEKSMNVFNLTGKITEERRIDETICRTASVLHTFIGLMSFHHWIEDCILALMKLEYKKNLDSTNKVVSLLQEKVNTKGIFFEKYLENIISRWIQEGFDIHCFQYKFFGCNTKIEFYIKYFDICAPLLLEIDRKDLLSTAQTKGLSEKDVLLFTATKTFVRALCDNVNNIDGTFLENNKSIEYLSKILGNDGLKCILSDNLDKLLIHLFTLITDEKHMYENFSENVNFMTHHLSLNQLLTALKHIETFICGGKNVICFLIENKLQYVERILLGLKLKMHIATSDEKLKFFQRYTIFVNMLIENLSQNDIWHEYFIRDTIYFLVHYIQVNINCLKNSTAASKYLKMFLEKILPTYSNIIENFLSFIVNALKDIYNATKSEYCLSILHFLIVDNVKNLKSTIEKLDVFPSKPEFEQIRSVHHKLKYGQKIVSLEEEIRCFLEYKETSSRQDSLVHLRKKLFSNKDELGEILLKLKNIRGFSEDCEKSLLHKLVITLVKITCSNDKIASGEAMKCLGEIGPINLRTLVLLREKEVLDIKCSSPELFSGHVVSLLNKYILDADIEVVKIASDIFRLVLNCKEGRKMADSGVDFGYGKLKMKFITPYICQKIPAQSIFILKEGITRDVLDSNDIWSPELPMTHKDWVVTLVSNLLNLFNKNGYLPNLIPLCQAKIKFCEHIFPLVIYLILQTKQTFIINILFEKLNLFFKKHWDLTNGNDTSCTEEIIMLNRKSVRIMLNVVDFIRQQKSYSKTKLPELQFNYLPIAKAAEFCGAHFTAILYIELWCQDRIEAMNVTFMDPLNSMIDIIFETEGAEIGRNLQKILRCAYKAIGDVTALPGCGVSYLVEPDLRVEYYKETNQWTKVMHFYEAQLSCGIKSVKKDLFDSYKKNGLYQLPLLYTDSEVEYECLWRLGQWNFSAKNKIATSNKDDYERFRFHLIKAFHDNDKYSFDRVKDDTNLCIINTLKHTSLECSKNLYPILSQLQSLNEMESLCNCNNIDATMALFKKWKEQSKLIKTNDIQYVEPIISQRICIVDEYMKVNKSMDIKRILIDMMLEFVDYAKEEESIWISTNVITKLQNIRANDEIQSEIKLREAQLAWASNDKIIARNILKTMTISDNQNTRLRSKALALLGQYMFESYSDNRMVIMNNLTNSVKLMTEISEKTDHDYHNQFDTYNIIASFADKQYQQIMTHMKSDLFQKKVQNMQKFKEIARTIVNPKNRKSVHIDEKKAAINYQRQSNIDEFEIQNAKKEKNDFLLYCLKYYLKNLIHSDNNNIKIFRVISLFLENKDNKVITETIDKYIPRISSYKYIPVLPQIIPHISENSNDFFGAHINKIVEKCGKEHPHHTLPLLLSLENSYKDKKYTSSTSTSSNDSRILTATHILKNLKKNSGLDSIISKLECFSAAIIELAYMEEAALLTSEQKKKAQSIPARMKIHKIKNYDDILCPTVTFPVSKNNSYKNVIGISHYSTTYRVVGGVNHPAQITCYGTDGKPYQQLAKGQDDLRQDAVMQQVFTIMNGLLASSRSTETLLIRTYKVVPMSMRSGLLEWVVGTTPIGEYLVEAHQQYRPQDRRPSSCRSLYQKGATRPVDQKLKIFKEICSEFKPVMHHFLEKSFPQATVWYERRRAYIHSVATTSMCGYILGIGDRHVSNILLDTESAELVHIDFGIAFEQGRCLPTPETVPFRLTRDIVDGMGISGVEGIFRSSCEKTMEVLRQNSQTIMTILEVLLYDPLYAWTVSSAEANKRQTESSDIDMSKYLEEENTNVTAERALLRLHGKLHGTEEGNPTSIEHQVATLIQQAMDPTNLCRLYHGWQPYM